MPVQSRPLIVMISSRNASKVRTAEGTTKTLTDVRLRAKAAVEQLLPYGNRVSAFEVWINEPSEAPPAGDTWFDESIDHARRADIVVVLFSGDPGSVLEGRGQGVCHAELLAAYADAPSKVRIVDVRPALAARLPMPKAHALAWRSFTDYVESLDAMTSRSQTDEGIVTAAAEAVSAATNELALHGIVAARRGSRSLGSALDWRRLGFRDRKAAMEQAVLEELAVLGYQVNRATRTARVALSGAQVLLVVAAAPEGLALAASRELVGQPQRDDHLLAPSLADGIVGPVHIIAVPARATTAQARALMGAADVITATFPAGIWIADPMGRAQALVVTDCADRQSTRQQLDGALEWLARSGESDLLIHRARRRAAIVSAMAEPDLPR
jgi:hypothetical protein